MAHEIPYVATATVAELRDLEAKVEAAMAIRGARYLHVFVPCPLGWGSASEDTIRIARLAKESGIFPVFEARDGEVTEVSKIRRQVPSRSICAHRALRHLLSPSRGPTSSPASRPEPSATSAASDCSETSRRAADGQALCPRAGNIADAEKIVAKLGIARSLERRFAGSTRSRPSGPTGPTRMSRAAWGFSRAYSPGTTRHPRRSTSHRSR